jgi:hypothetical protein
MRFILINLLFLPISFVQAQHHIPRCNFDSIYIKSLQSDDFIKLIEYEEIAFDKYLKSKHKELQSTYTIPVVVHIVQNEENTDVGISDLQIFEQIEIINNSYNALNNDISLTPNEFDTLVGNSEINFCLASVDPNGYSTNGITRTNTSVNSFSTSLNNIKYTDQGGIDAWDTDSYLNIWVGKITTGVLGYSNTPTSNIPDHEQGVVIGYSYFGYSDHSIYNMGKTAVHEIGHYLNLKHPWGIGGCDSNNDFVPDTPVSEAAYFGNPTYPMISCETSDMFMNYMDYVNDSSMVMFSQGQVDRMHFALLHYRPSILESNGCGTPLLISEYEIVHASDIGASDGEIHLDITSGIAPFSIVYLTDGDTLGQDILNLYDISQGNYSILITDSIGQQLTLNFIISYYGNLLDSDNFESYTSDSLLFPQTNNWSAFCQDSFAANIDFIAPFEGIQYLEINGDDGLNEISKNLGNLESNAYELSFLIYVPQSRSASYSIYYESSCSEEIAYQVTYDGSGNGLVLTGEQPISFSFPQGQWFRMTQLVDLDRDLVELFVGTEKVADWLFSSHIDGTLGSIKLGEIVFNGLVDSLQNLHYFLDDFKIMLVPNSDLINAVIKPMPIALLYPNPASNILNIQFQFSNTKPYQIQLINSLGQVLIKRNQIKGDNLITLNISDIPFGIFYIEFSSNDFRQVLRFVHQDD